MCIQNINIMYVFIVITLQKILGQNDHKCMVTAVSRFIEQVGSMIKGIPQHNYNS